MTVPPLALLFICAVAAYLLTQLLPLYSFDAPLWLVGFELVAALAFLLPALFGFKKHETTVNPISPDAATALVTDGVYSITRNPMYVGMLLALLGLVFWLGAVSALAMVFAFYFYIDRYQIRSRRTRPSEKVWRSLSRLCGARPALASHSSEEWRNERSTQSLRLLWQSPI